MAATASLAQSASESCRRSPPPARASTSPRASTSRFPRLRADNRPDQTHRRIVSAVRPARTAAALTSSSSAEDVFTLKVYYTTADPWSRSSPSGTRFEPSGQTREALRRTGLQALTMSGQNRCSSSPSATLLELSEPGRKAVKGGTRVVVGRVLESLIFSSKVCSDDESALTSRPRLGPADERASPRGAWRGPDPIGSRSGTCEPGWP